MQPHEKNESTKKTVNTLDPGQKLRKKSTAIDHMGKKLRHGKADTKDSIEETRRKARIKKFSRKEIYATTVLSRKLHQKVSKKDEDTNAGVDAANETTKTIEQTVSGIYAKKLKSDTRKERKTEKQQAKGAESSAGSQKQQAKVKKNAGKQKQAKAVSEETATGIDRLKKAAVEAGKEIVEVGKYIGAFAAANAKVILIIAIVAVIVISLGLLLQSCGMMFQGTTKIVVTTSYIAEDRDIIATDNDYKAKEEALAVRIRNIESEYPGYDEYRYHLAEINHNPFELAAILTVLLEEYTREEAATKLQQIFNLQYQLTTRRIVEVRTRETGGTNADGTPETEEYNYYILDVALTNRGMDAVARSMGFTADQMRRYEILVETKGNMPYLFADDIYAHGEPPIDYTIPGDALTDERFAAMMAEAQKYLGYEYVWGGSNPTTGFDCSGFVSWVLNHSGWHVGRQSANGLYNLCSPVSRSEAKPGDLIFFQGTYSVSGASHVGIYVGNNMMIHCGNPISFARTDTSYWNNHFYGFGRLP